MRIAYLDCFAGISGDMFLGALIDSGVPPEVLHSATAALNIGATLEIETVNRSGIACTKVHVLEAGELAEGKPDPPISSPAHAPEHDSFQQQTGPAARTQQPKTQHLHKGGHAHTHEAAQTVSNTQREPAHTHAHGRSLTEIRSLIQSATLDPAIQFTAIRAFDLLGASEAKIHNVSVDDIHFHEVGAVDAIVDIVASAAGIHHLRIGAWHSSPVNVGGGTVVCAHGTFPVPAPATADLLRGYPTYSAHVQKELVTPTGAALLRALEPTFGPQPAMRVDTIGYGAGTRNPEHFPNVLRLSVGESLQEQDASLALLHRSDQTSEALNVDRELDVVTVLETALDDLSPQVLAYVAEQALAAGALDVMLTAVIMKKGRPGTLLTLLCRPSDSEAMQALLLRETSTLGLRIRQDRRTRLERSFQTVNTPFGSVRMKLGRSAGEERNAAPEYEDCRAAAAQYGVPLKVVQLAAIAAYFR